jgi:hypothetical protein
VITKAASLGYKKRMPQLYSADGGYCKGHIERKAAEEIIAHTCSAVSVNPTDLQGEMYS